MFVCISPYLEESLALRPIPEARKQASQLMPLGVLETSILLLLWPSRQKDVTFLVTCENLWPAGTESRNQAQPLAEARNPQVGMEVDFSLFSLPTHLYSTSMSWAPGMYINNSSVFVGFEDGEEVLLL